MPRRNVLLVVISGSPGFRSALAAQLTLRAINVVTAADFADPAIARQRARKCALVIDGAMIGEGGVSLAALAAEPQWRRIVIVGAAQHDGAPEFGHVRHVAKDDALDALVALTETLGAE